MSLLSISKRITSVCDVTFTPTVIAAILISVYFSFHAVALGVTTLLLAADFVVSLNEKENNNE